MKLSWTPSLSSWGPCGATKSFVKTGPIHYIALQYWALTCMACWDMPGHARTSPSKCTSHSPGPLCIFRGTFAKKTRMIHDIKLLQISQKYLWINITFTKSIEELSRGIERWRKCHCNHNCEQGALDHYQNRVLTWDKAKQHSQYKILRTSGQFNTSLSTAATNRQQLNISCFLT